MTPGLGQATPLPVGFVLAGVALAGGALAILAGYALWKHRVRPADPPPRPLPTDETGAVDVAIESDEERVIALLRDSDSPVRQQQIVEATGWSDSKTSRVLTRLADENRITKICIGRENVIKLTPDPSAASTAEEGEAMKRPSGP